LVEGRNMKKIIFLILCSVLLSSCATAGKKIAQNPVKFLDSRVVYSFKPEISGEMSSMRHIDVYLAFENTGDKDISGLIYHVKFRDDFDNFVYEKTFEDDVIIKSKSKTPPDHAWIFYDSQDAKDNTFYELYPTANLGGTKTEVEIREIIFTDGTSLKLE